MKLLCGLLVAVFSVYGQALPVVGGVVNAGSFVPGPVAPGTIVSIFGTNLASQTLSATSLPLPTALAGTSVTLAGQALPLFFVSSGQINAQIPFGLPNGAASMIVRNVTGPSSAFSVSIATTSPAIFTTTADGKGAAISVHVDFKLVQKLSGQNANAGETIVLFCTGLGAVEGFSTAGVAGPSSPLARTSQTTTVSMDGRPAQVSYAGLVPGLAGLYQINFVVPVGVGGDVVTTVSVGGVSSNPTTINVRGAYTLGASYSGTITSKAGDKFPLSVGPFASQSATIFTGPYSIFSGTLAVDRGSFLLQSTTTVFALLGRSSITGGAFVGIMDTLDAGRSFFGLLYDTDSLDKVKDLDSWYASFVFTLDAPAVPVIPPILPGVSAACASIEGAVIFSGNQFLGRVTSNTFAADSIGNKYGLYGSPYSTTSIFNEYSLFGGAFSSTSAFNSLASNPPIISKGTAAAYLTTNQLKTPGIDPRTLYSCIGR
jgi:uncharacterized protein (TIGR03437 family)